MNRAVRVSAIGLAALLFSAAVTVCIPLLNHFILGGGAKRERMRIVAQVGIKNLDTPKLEQPHRQLKQPAKAKPLQTSVKAGPRFALDLAVGGLNGAAVPPDIVNRSSGGGGGKGESGDVDEKPSPVFPPPFQIPPDLKTAEKDAYLVLSFCVDPSGHPYDIRVAEEKPPGLGMAQAGREALRQTTFSPAHKSGLPVAFCGLEQPFEVKFNN